MFSLAAILVPSAEIAVPRHRRTLSRGTQVMPESVDVESRPTPVPLSDANNVLPSADELTGYQFRLVSRGVQPPPPQPVASSAAHAATEPFTSREPWQPQIFMGWPWLPMGVADDVMSYGHEPDEVQVPGRFQGCRQHRRRVERNVVARPGRSGTCGRTERECFTPARRDIGASAVRKHRPFRSNPSAGPRNGVRVDREADRCAPGGRGPAARPRGSRTDAVRLPTSA